ncbi:MAG TPA: DNA-binding protein WhiA, partial [Synergistetes bacterium]|nr:DNA-binding protein WhiA [Synergistota bacterium]
MEKLKSATWDEWGRIPNSGPEGATMEIAGTLSGLPSKTEGEFISFFSSRLFLFRRLSKLWNSSEWLSCGDFSSGLAIPRDLKGRVSIRIGSSRALRLMSVFERGSRSVPDPWNWIRGVFGSCGSLFLPKTGYYMVFRLPGPGVDSLEKNMTNILRHRDIPFRTRTRYGFREVVLRDQSSIVGMLSNMRLFKTSLILEEKAMLRSLRDRANKIVNCDASNIRKTLETAERQIKMAKSLIDSGMMSKLPEPLRDLLEVRIDNPTATLCELGGKLARPVSKSTVEYRWKKIEKIAASAAIKI